MNSIRPSWIDRLRVRCAASRLARADALAASGAHNDAFPIFVRAARSGLPAAQHRLGRCYLLGQGVPPSLNEAIRWLRRAARAGDVAAWNQLAALALQGVPTRDADGLFNASDALTQPDYDSAEHWSRLGAAAGSAEAKAILAFVLTSGPSAKRDEAAGEALYRESARAGWSRGQLGLAVILMRRAEPGWMPEAKALLKAAAADHVAIAHYLLATLAESGCGGEADLEAAAAGYLAAARLGHAAAQMRYGFALLNGRGVARDVFNAETWLRRAALQGLAPAAAVVGYLYAQGGDLPPNYAEAATWLERAAKAGHVGAARTLGRMYLLGTGLRRDPEEAMLWLRIAVQGGDASARDDMTAVVLDGGGKPIDQRYVARWLREDAEDGIAAARFKLGLCFAKGIGVRADETIARGWFLRAAAQGLPEAAAAAAEMLMNGRGGPADPARAMVLFQGAARAGHPGAHFALGLLMGDDPAAVDWFRRAAELGHAGAEIMLVRRQPAA